MEPKPNQDPDSIQDFTNGLEAQFSVNKERVEFLVEEICENLDRSHINARWRKGYHPRLLSEEDLGNGKYLIDRKRGREFYKTDLMYFGIAIEPFLLGKESEKLDLGQKVKKLLEFKFNLMENQSYGEDLFWGADRPGESREVAERVKKAMQRVDELVALYVRAAPAEKKSVEEKIYLNRENLDKLNYWAKRMIYAVDKQILELPVDE
jgi:hypothetical protein